MKSLHELSHQAETCLMIGTQHRKLGGKETLAEGGQRATCM